MSRIEEKRATVNDLYRTPFKAELIGGRIVELMATGRKPNRVAARIFRSLDDHAEKAGLGEAYTDNIGFIVPELASGRESFSPDASYFLGPFPENEMRFIQGPPAFAAKVRSENDYGDDAETEMAEKRADYFAAGTQVVWDVDPVNECVHVYRRSNPAQATTFLRGQIADAEPVLPGWRIAVNQIFGKRS